MVQRRLSFQEAVTRAIQKNYCNFDGRASRSEFWWYFLFTFILGVVMTIAFHWNPTVLNVVTGAVNLLLLLPGIGLSVRRLHDIGKSGWWLLLAFIPIIGSIILIVWDCQDSQMTSNEYGPVPNIEY